MSRELTPEQERFFLDALTGLTRATGIGIRSDHDDPSLIDVSDHLDGEYDESVNWCWPCPNCGKETVYHGICNSCKALWFEAEFSRVCGKPALIWQGSFYCREHKPAGTVTFSYSAIPTEAEIAAATCKKKLREDGTW